MLVFSSSSCFLFLLNIIVGTGVFLNTVPLYILLNGYSYLAYILTGFLMIPIICVTYVLAYEHPGFNLTVLFEKYFGNKNKILVPLYALSKFGTAVIGMVFISGLLKNIFFGSFAEQYYHYILFFLFYVFSCILVYYDISMHYILQKFIIIFKLIPLLVVILFFIFYFFNNSLSLNFFTFSNNNMFDFFKMAQGMSITIFAFAGFESLFAINHLLIGNKRKGALLLSISFLFSLILYVLYQFSISSLAALVNLDILKINSFSDFLTSCLIFMPFAQIFILLFNAAIMVSSFGVTHGILYAVINNLFSSLKDLFYEIKNTKYFIFFLVPFYGILGLKNIFILQQLSSLGTMVTYLLFILCYKKSINRNIFLLFFSFLSICIFFIVHFYNAIYYFGFTGYIFYVILIIILMLLYFFQNRKCI
jgi:hypothetical protein